MGPGTAASIAPKGKAITFDKQTLWPCDGEDRIGDKGMPLPNDWDIGGLLNRDNQLYFRVPMAFNETVAWFRT